MEHEQFMTIQEAAYLKELINIREALLEQDKVYYQKHGDLDVHQAAKEADEEFPAYVSEIELATEMGINLAHTKVIVAINEAIEKNRIVHSKC